jgi:PPOX class probable F420-dependent enzyme
MKLPKHVIELIEGKNFASFATIDKDGYPHVTVTWVDHENDLILINTIENRTKLKNAKRDPRVGIAIFSMENPYKSVYIKGKVVGFDYENAEVHIDKLAKKYLGKDKFPWRSKEKRVIIKIEPIKIVG